MNAGSTELGAAACWVLAVACVTPEQIEPVEKVVPRTCDTYEASVTEENLADVLSDLEPCEYLDGELLLEVSDPQVQFDLPNLRSVGSLVVLGNRDAVVFPALEEVAGGVRAGSASLPALVTVGGSLSLEGGRVSLPALRTVAVLSLAEVEALELPALEHAEEVRLGCRDDASLIDVPNLSDAAVIVVRAGSATAVSFSRLQDAGSIDVGGHSLRVLRAPLLASANIRVWDAPEFETLVLDSYRGGDVEVLGVVSPSLHLPNMRSGGVEIESSGDAWLSLPTFSSGRLIGSSREGGVFVDAPMMTDGSLDVRSNSCARDLRLPRFSSGDVSVSLETPCTDDVLDLPNATDLALLYVLTNDPGAEVGLQAPRLRFVGNGLLRGGIRSVLDLPALAEVDVLKVTSTPMTGLSLPNLVSARRLWVSYNPNLSSLELPVLEDVQEFIVVANPALPQCVVDEVATRLTDPESDTSWGNDDLAACQ